MGVGPSCAPSSACCKPCEEPGVVEQEEVEPKLGQLEQLSVIKDGDAPAVDTETGGLDRSCAYSTLMEIPDLPTRKFRGDKRDEQDGAPHIEEVFPNRHGSGTWHVLAKITSGLRSTLEIQPRYMGRRRPNEPVQHVHKGDAFSDIPFSRLAKPWKMENPVPVPPMRLALRTCLLAFRRSTVHHSLPGGCPANAADIPGEHHGLRQCLSAGLLDHDLQLPGDGAWADVYPALARQARGPG